MITLCNFGAAFGLPDSSPFVTKVEMLLKMAKLDYQTNDKGFNKAPKGKLPYIIDDGNVIADSTLIRFYLEEKYPVDFDKNLTKENKALSWAIEKMLEEHLYFAIVHARWADDANFAKVPAKFFDSVPAIIRPLIRSMVRKKLVKSVHVQGMGRHSNAEIAKLAIKDLEALSCILGDKPYLMGDTACGADATAFAFVSDVLCPYFDTPIRDATEKISNLVAYSNRLMKEFYPEYTT